MPRSLYDVVVGIVRPAARMSSIIANHSPPSPTTLSAPTIGAARTTTPMRSATPSANRSVVSDTEDPDVVTLERRLGGQEARMLALAVDAGRAVPQVERIGLARSRP